MRLSETALLSSKAHRLPQSGDTLVEMTIWQTMLEELTKNGRWPNGPAFLWKEEANWPVMINVPELRDSDPEVRKESKIYVTTASQILLTC